MKDFQNLTPQRAPGLEINPMPDGYMVYDPTLNRIHYLNPASALILELCDGSNSVDDIASAVKDCFGLVNTPLDVTTACIDQLTMESLIHA